ncbi:hypothetical protein P20495_3276 [Pseudoalteromonas sp. BSi20495]|nr:hypothetical protein P20495_3276 [Pseudoalteromonas sp. BSi20495]
MYIASLNELPMSTISWTELLKTLRLKAIEAINNGRINRHHHI